VAFDGEEAGLVGSSFMVQHMQVPPQQVKAMFSLDMVGMLSRYGGIDLNGDKTLENGDVMLHNLASKHGLTVKKDGRKVVLNTDTAPFGNQGIPAIHVFTSTVSPTINPRMMLKNWTIPDCSHIRFCSRRSGPAIERRNVEPSRKFVAQQNNKLPVWPTTRIRHSGQNYSNEFLHGKKHFAFQAGLYVKQRLNRRFALQPELSTNQEASMQMEPANHEVSIPVNVRMSLNPASAASTYIANDFYLLIGPYYSYGLRSLGGKNMDFDSAFRREDYGIQGGFWF
jgi:hypothetical protein